MIVTKTDGNVVGEIASPAFSINQNGGINFNIILKNSGVNTITYETQLWNGANWIDAAALGSALYSTLISGQVVSFQVTSVVYNLLQILVSASGGSFIDLSVQYFENRTSGGRL